jgi:hypothetical protein
MALSLRGIARRYGNVTGSFSVAQSIFNSNTAGGVSLRSRLENMAQQEFSFNVSECVYSWTAAFQQTWSHIRVRIRLNPDAGISTATMNTLRTTWQTGIQNAWSNQWGCGRPNEATCPFTFEVQWVNNREHHVVQTRQCPVGTLCQTNKGLWYTNDTGAVAAHEFGHMLGHPDEYNTDPKCPGRNPVNTGTIMDNNSNNIPVRLIQRFADNLGSNVVPV